MTTVGRRTHVVDAVADAVERFDTPKRCIESDGLTSWRFNDSSRYRPLTTDATDTFAILRYVDVTKVLVGRNRDKLQNLMLVQPNIHHI